LPFLIPWSPYEGLSRYQTEEAMSPQRIVSSTSKHEISSFFSNFMGNFSLLDPDPKPANHQNHCRSTTEKKP
jgi:hypothetical protein